MRVKNFCTIIGFYNIDTISCDNKCGFINAEMDELEVLTGVRAKERTHLRRRTHHEPFELESQLRERQHVRT